MFFRNLNKVWILKYSFWWLNKLKLVYLCKFLIYSYISLCFVTMYLVYEINSLLLLFLLLLYILIYITDWLRARNSFLMKSYAVSMKFYHKYIMKQYKKCQMNIALIRLTNQATLETYVICFLIRSCIATCTHSKTRAKRGVDAPKKWRKSRVTPRLNHKSQRITALKQT